MTTTLTDRNQSTVTTEPQEQESRSGEFLLADQVERAAATGWPAAIEVETEESISARKTNPLASLARLIGDSYDWLSGPSMTERDRFNLELIRTEGLRRLGPQLG